MAASAEGILAAAVEHRAEPQARDDWTGDWVVGGCPAGGFDGAVHGAGWEYLEPVREVELGVERVRGGVQSEHAFSDQDWFGVVFLVCEKNALVRDENSFLVLTL